MTPRRHSEGSGKLPGAPAPGRDASRAKRPASVDPSRMLQQSLGNQGVLRRMEAGLRINDVNDPAEKEADRVAAAVVRSSGGELNASTVTTSATPAVQRRCDSCAEEDDLTVHRKETSAAQVHSAPPIVGQVLNGPGQPLETSAREFMEARFGSSFGAVRIHTDSQAAESARAISATAYTVGNDLVFSNGSYSPQTEPGRRILAHELAHVIQQRRGGATAGIDSAASLADDTRKAANGAMRGQGPVRVDGESPVTVARLPDNSIPFIPFSRDQDVSALTTEQRQKLITGIEKRLADLDKQSAQPKPDFVVPGLGFETLEAERARLFDWKKKLQAGSGTLTVPGIARTSPTFTPPNQSSAATPAPPPPVAKPQRGTHVTPSKPNPLEFSGKTEDVFSNYYGTGTQQGSATNESRAHTTPTGFAIPTGVPHTPEETIAATNKDPHTKPTGDPVRKLEVPPLSQEVLQQAAKQFHRQPGEVTLPDGQVVIIPPRPLNEVTGEVAFGDDVLIPANVHGVRADVVRKLNAELESIERGRISREVQSEVKKARAAISEGSLESGVELTKAARSAQLSIPGGVAAMPVTDRLAEAVKRAILQLPGETGERIRELLTPESLTTIAAFTAVYIIAQSTPAGWLADIVAGGLLLASLLLAGEEVSAVVQEIADFVSIVSNAKTESDLDSAGGHLATAISKVGVDVAVAVLLHKAGKSAQPYQKPPPSANAVARVVTSNGKPVSVPLDAVPDSSSPAKTTGNNATIPGETTRVRVADSQSTTASSASNLSRNELLEEPFRARYHPNATTLSAKSAGFDFSEGHQTISSHTVVQGGRTLVDQRIGGGTFIQLKIVSETTVEAAVDNAKVAMERAENALKGIPKNKPELLAQGPRGRYYETSEENLKTTRANAFERVTDKQSYKTSYARKPDTIDIDLHFENVDPTDTGTLERLHAAAQEAIDNSVYKEDLPPVRLRVTAGSLESPRIRIDSSVEGEAKKIRIGVDESLEEEIEETTETGKKRHLRLRFPR